MFSPQIAAKAKQGFELFRRAFPDWREDIEEVVAEGNRVAARFKCSGTHRGEFMGMPPTGKRMEVTEVYFLTVVDGKIVDFVGVEDNLARLQQLGSFKCRSRPSSWVPLPTETVLAAPRPFVLGRVSNASGVGRQKSILTLGGIIGTACG